MGLSRAANLMFLEPAPGRSRHTKSRSPARHCSCDRYGRARGTGHRTGCICGWFQAGRRPPPDIRREVIIGLPMRSPLTLQIAKYPGFVCRGSGPSDTVGDRGERASEQAPEKNSHRSPRGRDPEIYPHVVIDMLASSFRQHSWSAGAPRPPVCKQSNCAYSQWKSVQTHDGCLFKIEHGNETKQPKTEHQCGHRRALPRVRARRAGKPKPH